MPSAPSRSSLQSFAAVKVKEKLLQRAVTGYLAGRQARKEATMTKDHGPSIKNDKQYEGLRKKGMSKERAAKIANSSGSSKRGGKNSS
jgi:hypothetical protein